MDILLDTTKMINIKNDVCNSQEYIYHEYIKNRKDKKDIDYLVKHLIKYPKTLITRSILKNDDIFFNIKSTFASDLNNGEKTMIHISNVELMRIKGDLILDIAYKNLNKETYMDIVTTHHEKIVLTGSSLQLRTNPETDNYVIFLQRIKPNRFIEYKLQRI